MSETLSMPLSLETASQDVQRLGDVLADEFESLKSRDLEAFESLQAEKTDLLTRLSDLAAWVNQQSVAPEQWQSLREALIECRESHVRNAQLMQRQLQGVRGALQALQGDQGPSLELYDRLGQLSRRGANWYQQLA
ncbi:flagellar export chaperone FlgN [Limnohabitans sp.]|jgi:flagellar biosynthesis/type III secretory pathway chaperone|uniref:flagellar export chaperone FlgN n=1 Tax=Limnohabitans sp. TaxID=1907725 RepID=UPI00391C37CA